MNPMGVLRAEDVMRPLAGPPPEGPRMAAAAKVRDVMALRAETGETVVVERDGVPVGVIGEAELLGALLGRDARGAA